ncbi:MAG: hypothetical protein COY74_00920 [Nitrosopumilales archaeon CG_4_10_14_0_8_um_filter_34_8]|nr:MAG: hypothetical protein COY74_00920 [Nitrosopumilales archaeon CG_4_10_14_0_8_um_filter_34_8]
MSQDLSQIARQSIQYNHRLLDTLGKEESVRIVHHPEEDVIKKISSLLPKSNEGKLVLTLLIGFIAFEILKKD